MTAATAHLVRPNHRIAAFYDRVAWLYPLVDWFGRPARQRLIERINGEPPGRVLDVGAGPGNHLRLYRGHAVTAIDCSPRMIARCRRRAPDVVARVMDGEALAFAAASFDYVVLCHVLSVTADPGRMLAEACRVLRPGGRIFVLNHETPGHAWRRLEALANPLAAWLCFRTVFRLEHIPGAGRLRARRLLTARGGLVNAYCLQR